MCHDKTRLNFWPPEPGRESKKFTVTFKFCHASRCTWAWMSEPGHDWYRNIFAPRSGWPGPAVHWLRLGDRCGLLRVALKRCSWTKELTANRCLFYSKPILSGTLAFLFELPLAAAAVYSVTVMGIVEALAVIRCNNHSKRLQENQKPSFLGTALWATVVTIWKVGLWNVT